ncbi:MAG: spore cortex biosynthesis protein YabQ [Clostridia bacterium]|nr:spore cortex biosynthesis protein YabQ [Clostridium sp.]MBS6252152.1 spore cortex biosynthesis protein YabQ [Clostridium sp.]
MLINQTSLFLIFTIDGVLIGIIFDIFRILRKTIKTSDFVTYIEDFLFWIITSIILFYSIFTYNNGELRFFMFLAVILGFVLYICTISSYLIKINVKIINVIKRIFLKLFEIIYKPLIKTFKILKKVIFKPILFVIINIRKNIKNIKSSKTTYAIKNDNILKNTNKTTKKSKYKIPKKKILQKKQKDTINLQKS